MKRLCFLLAVLALLLCSCLPNSFFSSEGEAITAQVTTDEVTTDQVTTESTPEITTPQEPPHEHLFETAGVMKDPTCIQAGSYTVTCSCGMAETREIPATGKHNYVENVCAWCKKNELTLVPVSSKYDADGDGQKDVYYFSPDIAQRCENGIWLWAGDYDKGLSTDISSATASEIQHWYVEDDGQRLTYRVTVPEAGVYEMIVHLRLKDDYVRGAKYTFNQGTELEQTFETSHVFTTTTLTQARNAETMGTYMYGIRVYLQGGENIFSITSTSQSGKSQHFREFFFVKIEESHIHNFAFSQVTKQPTCNTVGKKTLTCACGESKIIDIPTVEEHNFENRICSICGEKDIPLYASVSDYDADGDGNKDVYYFSSEQSNAAKQGVHVWAGNYNGNLSTFEPPVTTGGKQHWYVTNDGSQTIVYHVTVPTDGIYEMVLYMRLKDGEERGAKYIINEGTDHEQIFETSHAFDTATLEQVRDATDGTYMYGIYVNLVAGENIIKITAASASSKTQHFRDFYFVKVYAMHSHGYFLKTVVKEATCGTDGEVIFHCTCGLSRTVTVLATAKHVYADEKCLICKQEKKTIGIVDYEFLFEKAGFAGGTVSLLPEITGNYTLYWGNQDGKLPSHTKLGSFIAYAGRVTSYSIFANTAIPEGATCLLAMNSSGGRYVYSFVIPQERLLTEEKLYTFGALADTHQGTRYGDESQSLNRLINAGKVFSQEGALFVGIAGDIANDNTEREYILHAEALKEIYKFAPNLPVWSTSGNHESKYTGFSREWYLKYTRDVVDYQTDLKPIFTEDNDLDFVVEMPDGSVIIFLHQVYYDYGSPTSRLMDDYQLDWLGDRLEEYKDSRVFLFFHSQMRGKVGDFNGDDALTMLESTEDYKRLDAYFKQYTNVIFFNGHSHGSFDYLFSEEYGDRIFNTYGGEYATLVHIPSLANSSLGHIVHVYEDCIVFEGYHFGKEQTFAYATFIIEK